LWKLSLTEILCVFVQELNFQEDGQELHYGQILETSRHHHVWKELKKSCEFEKLLAEVEAFNSQHRWKKRGLSMVPTKFGISFTTKFLNQAGALVQVYTDGTVLVSHGGVEMGQGLHTKMAQIAASEFGIALKDVFVSETATDKVPNSSPTAASASADMYGGAVLDACQQLKARMDPVAAENQFATFAEV
jgi:xanthine dehydrogenase/oxidase